MKTQQGCSKLVINFVVIPAVLFLLGIAGFALTTDGFINHQNYSIVIGLLIMLICFWLGFIAIFRQIHIMAKGTVARFSSPWVIAAFVLAVLAIAWLARARGFFEPESVTSILRAVSVVCQGVEVPATGVYQSGHGPHIVLISDGVGGGRFNAEWKPASLGDVELVICLNPPTYTRIETCHYSMGGSVERYRARQAVRLIVAQTGEVLASKVVSADPGKCPSAKVGNDDRVLRGHVNSGQIEEWVLSILASPTHTPRPIFTAKPMDTQTPASTPLPAEVTFDTIRGFPAGHLVMLTGRLAMASNITCDVNECGLVLENPAKTSQTITIFVPVGSEPNHMKPLPTPYTKSDIQVQLDDGTFAVVGYRIRVTGRVCSSTGEELCISDIIKLELFQLK